MIESTSSGLTPEIVSSTSAQDYAKSQTVALQPDANGCFTTPAEGAKFMASLGIPQTPLNGKVPFLKDWPARATTDVGQIDGWYAQYTCNFGSVFRPILGEFYAMETDSPNPRIQFKEQKLSDFSTRLMIASGPGRGHWYYRHDAKSLAELTNIGQTSEDGFSLRVNNEQCVSPGSIHPERNTQYVVIRNLGTPDVAEPVEIEWWKEHKKKSAATLEPERNAKTGQIPHGLIHAYMLKRAGELRAKGLNAEEIEAPLLRLVHENCEPPIDEDKVRAMARNICKYPAGKEDTIIVDGKINGVGAEGSFETSPGMDPSTPDRPKYMKTVSIEQYLQMVDIGTLLDHIPEDGVKVIEIPPFDPTTMTGLAKEMAEFVIKGTTLAPQFAYGIAKTIIATRMAGHVHMEGVSAEPTRYFTAIGETGTGKGEAWRRMIQVLRPVGLVNQSDCGIKIINSADSGAGLKDFFFHEPDTFPVICYVDEISSLGNKAGEKKQPEILDTIIELADSTSVSRVLADKNGKKRERTKDDAHLSIVACGQDGKAYGAAFGSREKQGIYDRMTPEYGEPVEAGDMADIDPAAAYLLLKKLNELPIRARAMGGEVLVPRQRKVNMTMDADAKEMQVTFWKERPKPVRVKARFLKNLMLEAYVNAMSNGRLSVNKDDMDKAIRTFTRELAIRAAHFNTPIGDRVSYYSALIKEVTYRMCEELVAGKDPKLVAQTKRDYLTKTQAYRNSQEHIFSVAWASHERDFLQAVRIPSGNGRFYEKYLPMPAD